MERGGELDLEVRGDGSGEIDDGVIGDKGEDIIEVEGESGELQEPSTIPTLELPLMRLFTCSLLLDNSLLNCSLSFSLS